MAITDAVVLVTGGMVRHVVMGGGFGVSAVSSRPVSGQLWPRLG